MLHNKHNSSSGFTLVELIVVVTILAILATIGFVSYSSYLTGVRDTNRLAQLVSISDGLELYSTKNNLPLPDDNVEVQANGTTIAYQGYAGANTLETIDFTKGGKDPRDDQYFTYYLTKDRKYFQLMGFLEESVDISTRNTQNNNSHLTLSRGLLNSTHAVDYTDRIPSVYGKKLGILTDTTNTPIQEISSITSVGLVNFDGTGIEYVAHIDQANVVTSSGATILQGTFAVSTGKKNKDCKTILEKNSLVSGLNGNYWINPTGSESMEIYCDMTADGGGWTLFYANNGNPDSIIKESYSEMSTNVFDDSTYYDLGDYESDVLAGLINYENFSQNGAVEVLIRNKNSPIDQWGKITFSSKNTLNWMLNSSLVGQSAQCLDIPNGGTFSIFDNIGSDDYTNLSQVGISNGIGVSFSSLGCNGYTTNILPHLLFYTSNSNVDINRTRSNFLIGGTWGGDNQYRYFIR